MENQDTEVLEDAQASSTKDNESGHSAPMEQAAPGQGEPGRAAPGQGEPGRAAPGQAWAENEKTTNEAQLSDRVLRKTVSPVALVFAVIFILLGSVSIAMSLGFYLSMWHLLVSVLATVGLVLLISALVAARRANH